MPRYYAKKEKTIDFDNILEAIKLVKLHKNSIRQAAKAKNIPKSTLAWHISIFDKANIDVAADNVDVMKNLLKGVFPFNLQAFTENDFVASKLSGENACEDDEEDVDNQRRIIMSGDSISTAAHEEITTFEPSTSTAVSVKDLRLALTSVGPLKLGTPVKKSNRGRKPMKSAVLTSPECVTEIREKAKKKQERLSEKGDTPAAKKRKSTPATKKLKGRGKPKTPLKKIPSSTETDDEEDIDFCIICMENMPKKENRRNTAHCIACDRGVHLSCAGENPNAFTCVQCGPQ